jgi:hypothetical protein
LIKARLSNLRSGGSTTFVINFILSMLGAFSFGLFVGSVITEVRATQGFKNAGSFTGRWAIYIILAAFLIKLGILLA